jgi:hypothetical protein
VVGAAGAQVGTTGSDSTNEPCAVLNGIRIAADWGDSTGSGAGSFRLSGRTTIDTNFVFNVADRQWTRPWLRAYVAGGVSGRTSNATTTAAAVNSRDPRSGWHACVGALLGMDHPTLVMRGVRGQMHLKIDLTPLTRIPGATLGDSSRQNQKRR